jgi:hypothetical protein
MKSKPKLEHKLYQLKIEMNYSLKAIKRKHRYNDNDAFLHGICSSLQLVEG